jgi:pyruvate/2-oxoglutarate dehydrogenase complex dihydrolipoamide dehydrogenase (E3) component
MREGVDRDLVLQAVGRTLNGKKIAAGIAGVAVTDRGFINVDIQMRTNVPHIFAIGEIALAIEMGADYVDLGVWAAEGLLTTSSPPRAVSVILDGFNNA